MSAFPTDDELVDYFGAGKLVEAIIGRFGDLPFEDFKATARRCAELHSARRIDLLGVVQSKPFTMLDGPTFFGVQHFFTEAIPHIECEPQEMMALVKKMVEMGGNDMMATQPNASLREWFRAKPERAAKVIASARSDDALAIAHLCFALEANAAFDEARAFAREFDDDRRLSALTALGRLQHPDDEGARTLALLADLQALPQDDQLRSAICATATSVMGLSDDLDSRSWTELVGRSVEGGGELLQLNMARSLWTNEAVRKHADLVPIALRALARINPTHSGTIDSIDQAMRKLWSLGHHQAVLTFMTELLSGHADLTLKQFPSLVAQLRESSADALVASKLIDWLRSGESSLCDAAVLVATDYDDRDTALSLPEATLRLPPHEQVFVCRKAIAYFFARPIVAASILVAFIRVADDETAQEISAHLFNPLLINYGGSIADYLRTITEEDKAHTWVYEALEKAERYVEGLRSVDNVRELLPSEHNRQLEGFRTADEAAATFRAAEKQSVLLKFVKRSTLLHGRRSVSYIQQPGGARRAFEMDLQSHGFSMEMPRMLISDPVGLEYLLTIFKIEKLKS